MNEHQANVPSNRQATGRLQALRGVSNQIVEKANSGIPRMEFFREVSQMLVTLIGCDIVRMVLVERGRRYRCETTSDAQQPFRFDVAPGFDLAKGVEWSSGASEAFEQFCRDLVADRIDRSQPWISENGSLWTGDISSLTIEALGDADPRGEPCIGIDADCQSLALIPIDIGEERVGLLEIESRNPDLFTSQDIEEYERIAQTFGIALAHRRLQVALRERVKELT